MQLGTMTVDWPWMLVTLYVVWLVWKPRAASRFLYHVLSTALLAFRAVWPF